MRARVAWLLGAMSLAGCVEKTVPIEGLYCDATTPCRDASQVCLLEFKVCVVPDGGNRTDMGLDADMTPAGCSSSSECTAATPICASMSCRACAGAADDAQCAVHNSTTPRCGSAGQCVACRSDTQTTDCTSATAPICGANNTCRGCQLNSECTSGICKADGTCAADSEIIFVNNGSTSGCQAAGPGTRAMPFCEIQPGALAAITASKPFVLVAGSATAYTTAVNLTTVSATIASLTILGPGRSASPTARLAPSIVGNAFALSTTGNPATVVIDGLELVGQGAGSSGIRCSMTSGAANLTIRNSLIRQSGGPGIDSNSCAVTLAQSVVTGNAGGVALNGGTNTISQSTISANTSGGLSITGGVFVVENNFIVDNSGSAPGVSFSGSPAPASRFRFNTVAGNKRSGTNEGGIICPGGGDPFVVEHSIVFLNDKKSMRSVVGNCSLVDSFIDDTPTPAGGNFSSDPKFVDSSASNYRIQSSSPAKDKVAGPGNPAFPTVDVDGNPRPRPAGGSWDIGAFEAQ